jgi:hypothetical protein
MELVEMPEMAGRAEQAVMAVMARLEILPKALLVQAVTVRVEATEVMAVMQVLTDYGLTRGQYSMETIARLPL